MSLYILEAFNNPDMERYNRAISMVDPQQLLEEMMIEEWKEKDTSLKNKNSSVPIKKVRSNEFKTDE